MSNGDRPLVLVADDDPIGREILEAMLEEDGYELLTAADGAEALSLAEQRVPDLLVLDVMMPGLDGFEVLRRVRASPRLGEVPAILVTALHDRDSRLRGIEAGADDFLTKPIDRAELRARVRTVTRLDRFRHLLAERAKFEWAVETSGEGYLVLDADDVITYANRQARSWLALPVDGALPGLGFDEATRAYRREPEGAWGEQGDAGPRYLVRPETAQAPAFWLELGARRLPKGTGEGSLVRLRDVTERWRSRRETWAFHSAIGHKLRTPLTTLLPGLELLSGEVGALSAAASARLASTALQSVRRLASEINQILEYVELTRGPQVGGVFTLDRLAELSGRLAEEHSVQAPLIRSQTGPGGVAIGLSAAVVELVLGELVENARKFHPSRKPALEIAIGRPEGDHVRLTVRDDGPGLPTELLTRVLTPYFQAERDHTGQVPGLGLGLATVAAVVWSAGGEMTLLNRTDCSGLVVELNLPLAGLPRPVEPHSA